MFKYDFTRLKKREPIYFRNRGNLDENNTL